MGNRFNLRRLLEVIIVLLAIITVIGLNVYVIPDYKIHDLQWWILFATDLLLGMIIGYVAVLIHKNRKYR